MRRIVARWISLGGFAVVALGGAVAGRTDARLSATHCALAYFTLLAGLLLATTWFQAWYVVWPLGLGAALAEPRRHLEVALLSLGGLLQYFVFIYLWVMGVFPADREPGRPGRRLPVHRRPAGARALAVQRAAHEHARTEYRVPSTSATGGRIAVETQLAPRVRDAIAPRRYAGSSSTARLVRYHDAYLSGR